MFKICKYRLLCVLLVLIGLIQHGNPDPVPLKCEKDTCASTAKCVNTGSYIYCECPLGKTGANCTLDDPCLPQTENCPEGKYCAGPCDPNVICEGATGEPRCRGCIAGWTGRACDIDMDECFHVPYICSNGGTCINVIGDFTCACTPEWTGKECRCKKGTACEKEIDQNHQQTTPANGKPRFSSNFSTCILAVIFYRLLST